MLPTNKLKIRMLRFGSLLLSCLLVLAFALPSVGCQNRDQNPNNPDNSAVDSVSVHVASLKGPTSIGLVDFMGQAKDNPGQYVNDFQFEIAGTADEILPKISNGNLDIALVPANVAAVLYNKTKGGIQVLNINTLGVLYVVSADSSINSLADLKGRTVLMTGKGTTPEYVMDYLLAANGLDGQVNLEYKSEATELAATLTADPTAIALLPEPYVTSVASKNPDIAVRVSLKDAWASAQGPNSGQLVTAVTIARTDFITEHPDVVAEFMSAQEASVNQVNRDPEAASELVVANGIMDNAQIAAKAIPNCNLVYIVGSDMYNALSGYLQVLYDRDPAAIGGALPDDGFYYQAAPEPLIS